jgi:hypothetical protein
MHTRWDNSTPSIQANARKPALKGDFIPERVDVDHALPATRLLF